MSGDANPANEDATESTSGDAAGTETEAVGDAATDGAGGPASEQAGDAATGGAEKPPTEEDEGAVPDDGQTGADDAQGTPDDAHSGATDGSQSDVTDAPQSRATDDAAAPASEGAAEGAESSGDADADADVDTDADADVLAAADGDSEADLGLDVEDSVLGDEDSDEEQGLFEEFLDGDPIFENREVLRPSYTPRELPHRSEQINKMATILVSALRGDTPSNILIYGKTGTGKTASAQYVSQELERTSQKYEVPCDVEYINCEVTDTQYRVLAKLANEFNEENRAKIDARVEELEELRDAVVGDEPEEDEAADEPGIETDEPGTERPESSTETDGPAAASSTAPLEGTPFDSVGEIEDRIEELRTDREEMEEVPMTGWPTDRVYNVFFDAVDYRERVVVIMLDEIDKLVEKSGDDTLYNLSRMNSDLDHSRVSIIGISNDLKFTDLLDPRVKSSLGEEEIVFPPYDATQLQDILEHRAAESFKPDALSGDVIPLCAAFAAQEHGDARRALDLLRTAGELAEQDDVDEVQGDHVRKAQEKIELDRVVEVVRTLPMQSKLVLYAIIHLEQKGVASINTGEVYNVYNQICEEIDADSLTQRRVTDLISELDMLGIVNAVVVSKGRYGRTKEINLSVPLEQTEAVLTTDSRLGELEEPATHVQSRFDS